MTRPTAITRAVFKRFPGFSRQSNTNQSKEQHVTTPTTISIDGTEYVKKDDLPAGPPTTHRIVVVDRGWVFVGNSTNEDDGAITISSAKVVRIWGTDSDKPGLGWLALNGPTDKTKLDPSGTVRVPAHAVVATFDTEVSKWA